MLLGVHCVPGSILNALPILICHSVRWVLQEDTHWSPRYREDPGTYHFSNYHSLIARGWECNLNSGSLSVNCQQTAWGGEWRGCTGRLKHSWRLTWTCRKASALPPCGNLGHVCCQELEHLSEGTLGNDRLALGTNKDKISTQRFIEHQWNPALIGAGRSHQRDVLSQSSCPPSRTRQH